MKNIFSMFQGYVDKPKRNVFDMSFNNNFSTEFGKLTPVFCKPVVPGESYKIDTAVGLRLMPMAFPVQTPMKAYVHYFYVRNRALWSDWKDFITGVKSDLVPPYIDVANFSSDDKRSFFSVGELADYLGVPNVVYGGDTSSGSSSVGQLLNFEINGDDGVNIVNAVTDGINTRSINYKPLHVYTRWLNINNLDSNKYCYSYNDAQSMQSADLVNSAANALGEAIERNFRGQLYRNYIEGMPPVANQTAMNTELSAWLNYNNTYSTATRVNCNVVPLFETAYLHYDSRYDSYVGNIRLTLSQNTNALTNDYYYSVFFCYLNSDGRVLGFKTFSGKVDNTGEKSVINITPVSLVPNGIDKSQVSDIYLFTMPFISSSTGDSGWEYGINYRNSNNITFESVDFVISEDENISALVIGEGNYSITPFDSDIPLSALPFRAYECIYNSYYRNMQNNPYILNGVEEYNKFIPTNDGGADSNVYKCYYRNWEYDFLTSAVHSPQFGVAPLVGITMTGAATFQDENGTTYYAQAELDDDGTITGWSTHSSNMPAGTLRMLMDSVGTGISINDLRNVNSFQRFLENSLRVGLKYRDQIKGHFGVDVAYNELDMPEFIGGMSLDVNINPVTQTADIQDTSYPLGGQVGQGGAFGSSQHSVTKYCDEHGFIIGILSVVPVPVYSQLLPKFFTYREQLDYFFPEFGHIGYQPILQKEVSPLQSYYNASDLNAVFGYQRAWYDLIASTDEVHSQFRTTLRDFVMNRTFENEPSLNEDFLLVDPAQCNDVFLSTDSDEFSPATDKILGQIYFKAVKKSPIPKLGIPRLTD